MRKPFSSLIAGGLCAALISGCATTSMPPIDTPDKTKETREEKAPAATAAAPQPGPIEYADFPPEVLYLLLSGEVAAQRGRYDVTLLNYLNAAKQSRDVGVIRRAMRIAQSLNADNAQKQLAKTWLEVEPENLQALRILAIQAVKSRDLETALTMMEKIMDLGGDPDFDSLAAMTGQLATEQQEELLGLYQELEQRHPENAELEYSIALVLKLIGQQQQGLAKLDALIAREPNFQPALLLKGDLLYETGQTSEALAFMQSQTRRYPDNRRLGTLYGRMLISENELQSAQDEFARLIKRFPDVSGLRLSYALVALENGNPTIAEKELKELVTKGHHLNEANYYLGRIADDRDSREQAITYYEQVSDGNYYLPALSRASELKALQGDLTGALKDLTNLREKTPEQAENLWLVQINLLTENDLQDEAIAAATEALEAYPENVRIRYTRAMQLDSLDQVAAAEKDLRIILDNDPQNSVALNALGYILTVKTDRFDEARTYIEQALELDPENPAILDSMGWVLFKQGDLEAAKTYLEKAWNAFTDPEVAAHLGEVLWVSGDESGAREVWQQGLDINAQHPVLNETINRVTGKPAP